MNPLVSVVIPTYNRARALAVALDSVRNQTYGEWETLVVDNSSVDNTREIIRKANDSRIRYFSIQNNGVIAASRNLGLRQAKGELVAFLDSDDCWTPDKLKRSVLKLQEGFDIVYHDMRIVPDTWLYLGARKFRTRQLSSPVFSDLLVNGNTLPTSSVVARRTILLDVGGFREDKEIIAGEDYDLWLRLSKVTERFGRVKELGGYLIRGGDGEFSAGRLISIISETEQRYLPHLTCMERAQAHGNWIDYARVRALYRQERYDAVQGDLLRLLGTSRRISFRIKAAVMLITIGARRALRGLG